VPYHCVCGSQLLSNTVTHTLVTYMILLYAYNHKNRKDRWIRMWRSEFDRIRILRKITLMTTCETWSIIGYLR